MPDLVTVIALLAALVNGALLVYVLRRAPRGGPYFSWLVVVLGLGLLGALRFLLPGFPRSASLGVFIDAALIIVFGLLSLAYLQQTWHRVWLIAGGAWGLVLLAVDLLAGQPAVGQSWLGQALSTGAPAGWIALLGWLVAGLALSGAVFYAFYTAPLPEVANRALFWTLVILPLLLGVVFSASGTYMLAVAGLLGKLAGMGGAIYAAGGGRVLDVRRGLRQSVVWVMEALITALLIFAVLMVAESARGGGPADIGLLFALGVIAATLYVAARVVVSQIVGRFLSPAGRADSALRHYSQRITAVIEPGEVLRLVTQTLVAVLRARPGGIILITSARDGVTLEAMTGGEGGALPSESGALGAGSPIYQTLVRDQQPLLQYDLEFNRRFAGADPAEVAFFRRLRMSAYAPIVIDGLTIGLLASGPRLNDEPFGPPDLDLLATLASQTGAALRNARLVTDLRRLNRELAEANEGFSTLDRVKTDFITIASHELRTPLAQIRGYADIIETFNDADMLEPAQMTGLIGNLRRATERMEILISDMLDVSKLDVDAMDLHFAEITLESVIRMAIEPLTDAMRSRKLTFSARGLRSLPSIEADMQRLVQAFRNVIVNAVKYTPDGGLIEVEAAEEANASGRMVHVMVRDSGVGIDPAHHELVFEKFFRAADPSLHSTGSTKFLGAGPGLGLTITRGMIEGHGGRIWVESAGYDPVNFPGSTFHIVLPIHPPADARHVQPFDETRRSIRPEERAKLAR